MCAGRAHSSENGNDVTLVGNVTSDPELRFTATGQATASFGLAVNRVWTDRQVSWFLRTLYIRWVTTVAAP